MLLIKLLIMTALTFAFISGWQSSYEEALFQNKGNYVVVLSYVVILFSFTNLYGGFKIGLLRLHEIIYSFLLSIVLSNFIMYLELCLIARQMLDPSSIVLTTLFQIAIMAIGVISANTVYFKLYKAKQILAVFGNEPADRDVIRKMKLIKERYVIAKGITVDRNIEDIKAEIDKYEAVLICDFDKTLKNEVLRYCYATRKRIYLLPSPNDIILNNCYQSQIFDTPVLVCKNRGLTTEQILIKRAIDLVISAIGLVLTSPLIVIISLAIKLCDGGPVLFKQNRVTQNGRIFNVYKFRSMVIDADKDGAIKATNGDSRITPIGKIIRPLRLDELPQLFNILKGDMSLVGPRPERTENVHEYTQKYPEFNLRHRVKGGLTGYAQIYGKYNTSPVDKLNMDLIYIEKYSILLDIKLILMTLKIIFMKESTEGFSETANANVKKPKKNMIETQNKNESV